MKTELKYAVKEIQKYPFSYVVLLIQLIVSFYILFNAINFSINISKENIKFEKFIGTKNGCILIKDENNKVHVGGTTNLKENLSQRYRKFYKFLEDNPYFIHIVSETEQYSTCQSGSLNHLGEEMYFINKEGPFKCTAKDGILSCIFVNRHFFDVYNLKFSDKSKPPEGIDYEYTGSQVNIVLGQDFKKYYKIDDVIHVNNAGISYFPNRGIDIDLKIVGFLENDSYYVSFMGPSYDKRLINLNKHMVVPLNLNMDSTNSRFENSSFREILYYINILSPDVDLALRKINEENNSLRLSPYIKMRSWSDVFQDSIKNFKEQTSNSFISFISMAALAISGMIFSMLMFIDKERYKIGINLLCGATLNKIMLRFVIQISLVVLIALMTVLFLVPFNLMFTGFMLMSSLFIITITTFPTINKLKRKNITDFIRSKE